MEAQVEEVEVVEERADQEVLAAEVVGQAVEQECPDNPQTQSMLLSNLCCTDHPLHHWGSLHKSFRRPNYSNNIGVLLPLSRPDQHKTRCTS
jgi:hypothetical protein